MEATIPVLLMRTLEFKQLLPRVITYWETDLGIEAIFDSKAYKRVEHSHCLEPLGLANFLDFTTFGKQLNSC